MKLVIKAKFTCICFCFLTIYLKKEINLFKQILKDNIWKLNLQSISMNMVKGFYLCDKNKCAFRQDITIWIISQVYF
jgi:hypothetical protein